ncbi:MAG: hypothetical protein H6668_16975 [Ardenticatenaceae bacterium]|nr:hypothetical protein [Ardenticatenaceae bacterium]
MVKTKYIEKGKWRTVEFFWNAKGTAFFKLPPGAQIKVRYGVGWLGKDSQKQTLNGEDYKELSVSGASIAYARMQIKVKASAQVTYELRPEGIGISSPKVPF